jgi:Transposase
LVRHEEQVVAIERPDGLLVDRILAAGIRILPLHPNQVAASRDRFRASGGKSDRFDRFVLCELARTDSHRFRVLEPDSDRTKALRALTRAREDLVTARVAMGNQLRAELERFWPGPVRMFSAIDSPVSLAFLAKYPSQLDAEALGEKRLAAFLKAHGSPKAKCAGASVLRRVLRSARKAKRGWRWARWAQPNESVTHDSAGSSSSATAGSSGYRHAMTQEDLVYRPEVLAEYGFLGTPDDLMEELRNGMQLHREGVSYAIWHALTPEERAIAVSGQAIRDTTP